VIGMPEFDRELPFLRERGRRIGVDVDALVAELRASSRTLAAARVRARPNSSRERALLAFRRMLFDWADPPPELRDEIIERAKRFGIDVEAEVARLDALERADERQLAAEAEAAAAAAPSPERRREILEDNATSRRDRLEQFEHRVKVLGIRPASSFVAVPAGDIQRSRARESRPAGSSSSSPGTGERSPPRRATPSSSSADEDPDPEPVAASRAALRRGPGAVR
jgi:hypothetical protein